MLYGSEGGDAACFCQHEVPSVLADVENVLVGGEQAVAEEVVFEILPGFFRRIAFRGNRGNFNQGYIVGDTQILGAMPAGAVGDHGSMHLWG
jgi:hypothetical protein